MFAPDVYPLNTARRDGWVSEERQAPGHPLEKSTPEPAQNDDDQA